MASDKLRQAPLDKPHLMREAEHGWVAFARMSSSGSIVAALGDTPAEAYAYWLGFREEHDRIVLSRMPAANSLAA